MEEALRWRESFAAPGFRETIRRRDAPFADYGERPRLARDEGASEPQQ